MYVRVLNYFSPCNINEYYRLSSHVIFHGDITPTMRHNASFSAYRITSIVIINIDFEVKMINLHDSEAASK